MKPLKNLTLILVSIALTFSLFACAGNKCTEHKDENKDGICDTEGCGAAVENGTEDEGLVLIENGKAKFQIVLAGEAPEEPEEDGSEEGGSEQEGAAENEGEEQITPGREILTATEKLVQTLLSFGVEAKIVFEEDAATDCEILIGGVETRGADYCIDSHSYGPEGYFITLVGSKVVVNGGSVESTVKAIEALQKNIFGIKSSTTELTSVVMSSSNNVSKVQNNFYTESIKIGENDIKDYVIVIDTANEYQMEGALKLQSLLYEEAGIWLSIANEPKEDGKMILFSNVEKDSTSQDSFRVVVEENTLKIISEYENSYTKGVDNFFTETITKGESNIVLDSSLSYTLDVSIVYYDEFGAAADGKTNDFEALLLTHQFANISGQTVKGARKGEGTKKYYIQDTRIDGTVATIDIMTNVDWNNTHFIIDDSKYSSSDGTKIYSQPIFRTLSPYPEITLEGDILEPYQNAGPNTKKFDLGLGYPAMIIVTNSEHRVYIRYGANANEGNIQEEVVLIDAEGNVVEGTELMLDYEKVTSITVIRADVEPITIEGGTVTRYATRVDTTRNTTYFLRNLQINRSNTTVKGLKQYNENEFTVEEQAAGKNGAPYRGFFWAYRANHVTFEDCVMTAPRYYAGGTYGLGANFSNDILFLNCTQSNFYKTDSDGNLTNIPSTENSAITGKREYWGIGGSNYCKNMVYDGCMLTRYDAHAGVYGGKIINSTIVMLNLIGGGDMLIENTTIIMEGSTLINLRDDYGSTFKGTITLRNCKLKPFDTSKTVLYILGQKWQNHYFGYTCHMPNVVIDNLTFAEGSEPTPLYLYSTATSGYDSIYSETKLHQVVTSSGAKNLNPLTPAEYFKIINNYAGLDYRVYDAPILNSIDLITDSSVKIMHQTYGK